MEYYVAESDRPLDRCLRDVAECDLYIGVFAWRYGYIPPGQEKSITELEYRTAAANGKPTLVFILKETASWPRTLMDRDSRRIESLREELCRDLMCSFFSTPQELAALVAAAVHNQLRAQGASVPGGGHLQPDVMTTYYQRITQQYGRLDLETLTPSQYEDQLRIELNSIFVEPDVRQDLPVLDLPKDLQKWLAAQENLDDRDLPEGLDAEELDRLRNAYQQRPRRRIFDLLGGSAPQRVVLLGDPGAGKSTLVRYLALSLADPPISLPRTLFKGYIPILIELKSYEAARRERQCTTLLEFSDLLFRSEGLGLPEGPLQQYLSDDGRAVVLFDGLDEIFDPAHRAAVTRQIAAFAARYPKVTVVVTSRIIGYSRNTLADAGFVHVTLQDLEIGQIADFLSGWYALALHDRPADAAQRKDRLLTAIEDSRSIGEMAGNPLLLTILAIIGRHQELPRDRWKVYDYAATVLVERWEVNRHLHDERLPIGFVSEDDKKELLRRVALRMQTGTSHDGGNYLTAEELRQEFEGYLQARFRRDPADAAMIAQAMIRQFRERNFILSRYGGELYGFVHRAFLEFFCAEAFRWQFEKDRIIDLEYLKLEVFGRHWSDASWREVLRLIAGTMRERWIGQIVTFLVDEINMPWPWQFKDTQPWNVALAAQCLAERRMVPELDHAYRRVLVRIIQLLEHGILDEDVPSYTLLRTEIIPAVAAVGPAWPGREIYFQWYMARGARLVWAPISELAARIAASLFRDESKLLGVFLDSIDAIDDSRLTDGILDLIGHFESADPEVRALALDRATHDDNTAVRAAALLALGGAPAGPEIRALLVDRAAHDHNWAVRAAALQALGGALADPEVRALALDRAAHDDSGAVREVALQALGGAQADPEVRALLVDRAAHDDSGAVRAAALRALGGAQADPEVRALLVDRAAHDDSGAVREVALQALGGAQADPEIRALLVDRAAHDDSGAVRAAALRALGGPQADPEIRALLVDRAAHDDSWAVRQVALLALGGAQADPEIRALLMDRAAHDDSWAVREAALLALGGAPADPEIRALLMDRAAHDDDEDVRQAALQALSGAQAEPEVRALLMDRAAHDDDEDVRQAALQALSGAQADPEVRALLMDRAAHDDNEDVREVALQALSGAQADPEIGALALDRAAHDDSGAVRQAALQALSGAQADPEVRALLVDRAAHDDNEDVRQAALQALSGALADPEVRALLVDRAAHDDNEAVRQAALQALGGAPADPEVRALALDRAHHDDEDVRAAALRALSGALADPEVRALLVDRAAHDDNEAVRQAALQALSGAQADPEIRALALDRAHHDDSNWIRQLAVRIASCSAEFAPDSLPIIESGNGILWAR